MKEKHGIAVLKGNQTLPGDDVGRMAVNHFPFKIVESGEWKELVNCINPRALNVLPKCADTSKNWTMSVCEEKRRQVAAILSQTQVKVHISFDGWTSGNGLELVAIVATWYDVFTVTLKNALLGLKEIEGRHIGENLASSVSAVLNEFGLTDERIGCYILDNAFNNDKAVDILDDVNSNRRLHCFGHILNLCVRALLGAGGESSSEYDGDLRWKGFPGLSKLHRWKDG